MAKTDCYGKDLLFVASFAFFVITFEPIMIQTCSAPQNDCLLFSFVKDIKVGVEKITRNCRKIIKKRQTLYFCQNIAFNFRLSSYYSLLFRLGKKSCQLQKSDFTFSICPSLMSQCQNAQFFYLMSFNFFEVFEFFKVFELFEVFYVFSGL